MNNFGVVILHYQDKTNTKECLESVLNNRKKDFNFQVIVVINSDEDKEQRKNFSQELKQKYSQILVLESNFNSGFAGGSNLGIKKALSLSCDSVVVLNNDTFVAENFFRDLIAYANTHSRVGLISPKIYFSKGYEYHKERYKESEKGKVIWYGGGIIDWDNIYVSHKGVDEVDTGQYEEIAETPFVTGCCMLIKKEVIKRIGLLDENYFLYFEDVDYSLKAKRAGFQVIYYPKVHLWHKNAASSGRPGSRIHLYYQTRNRLYFGFKYAAFWTKKSLFFESIKMIVDGGIKRKACLDYYLGKMGRGDL